MFVVVTLTVATHLQPCFCPNFSFKLNKGLNIMSAGLIGYFHAPKVAMEMSHLVSMYWYFSVRKQSTWHLLMSLWYSPIISLFRGPWCIKFRINRFHKEHSLNFLPFGYEEWLDLQIWVAKFVYFECPRGFLAHWIHLCIHKCNLNNKK